MRILWIKTELLHPVDKGGRIRTYQMLRSLLRSHEIVYLCLDDGEAAPDAQQRADEYCSELITIPFSPASKNGPRFAVALLRNLFSTLPYAVARYHSERQRQAIQRTASTVDLVVCDFLFPSQNVPSHLPAPVALFQHNVEAVIWQRHAAVAHGFVRRAYMLEQWRRMRNFEAAECRRFDHVIAVSEADATTLRKSYGIAKVSSISTGVDLPYFAASARQPGTPNIVFVGAMDWMPNDDGIRWFVNDVFPRVRTSMPDATLTIVGRHPPPALRKLAATQHGIEITGSVADVRPYLSRASISVVPLRIGGGTRLKIYEAMASSVPVVSTSIGAEGLPVRHNEHLLLADGADAMSEALIHLLNATNEAQRLASNALAFVNTHCSWDAVAEQFLEQCLSIARLRAA